MAFLSFEEELQRKKRNQNLPADQPLDTGYEGDPSKQREFLAQWTDAARGHAGQSAFDVDSRYFKSIANPEAAYARKTSPDAQGRDVEIWRVGPPNRSQDYQIWDWNAPRGDRWKAGVRPKEGGLSRSAHLGVGSDPNIIGNSYDDFIKSGAFKSVADKLKNDDSVDIGQKRRIGGTY